MIHLRDVVHFPGQWTLLDGSIPIAKGTVVAAYVGARGSAVVSRNGFGYIIDSTMNDVNSTTRELTIPEAIEAACERLGVRCPDLRALPERMR